MTLPETKMTTTIIIVIVAAVLGIGSQYLFKGGDNIIEEATESVIDDELHLPAGTVNLSIGTSATGAAASTTAAAPTPAVTSTSNPSAAPAS